MSNSLPVGTEKYPWIFDAQAIALLAIIIGAFCPGTTIPVPFYALTVGALILPIGFYNQLKPSTNSVVCPRREFSRKAL